MQDQLVLCISIQVHLPIINGIYLQSIYTGFHYLIFLKKRKRMIIIGRHRCLLHLCVMIITLIIMIWYVLLKWHMCLIMSDIFMIICVVTDSLMPQDWYKPRGYSSYFKWNWFTIQTGAVIMGSSIRADSRLASSQWETSLQCNPVSDWLGANLESALQYYIMLHTSLQLLRQNKIQNLIAQKTSHNLP